MKFSFLGVERVEIFMLKIEELKFRRILHYCRKEDILNGESDFFTVFFFYGKNGFFLFFLKNDGKFLFEIIIRFLFQKSEKL